MSFFHLYDRVKPHRFKDMSESDLRSIFQAFLCESSENNVEMSEKIAGQHLTVKCHFNPLQPKRSDVRVFTKDSILKGSSLGRNGKKSSWGRSFTRALFSLFANEPERSVELFGNKLETYVWSFEIANPKTNHDFIRYKNYETVYCEYTGFLNEEMLHALRDYLPRRVKLLGINDVKFDFSSLRHQFKEEFQDVLHHLKKDVDDSADQEMSMMFPANEESDNHHLKRYRKKLKRRERRRSKTLMGQRKKLKKRLGDFIEKTILSKVDDESPVEGVVFRVYQGKEKNSSYREYKLQTNTYLKLQRGQMPLYSLVKLGKKEKKILMKYPNVPIITLQKHFGKLNFHPIIDKNQSLSLSQTLQKYLAKGKRDNKKFDQSDYRVWFSSKQARLLSEMAKKNPKRVYKKLFKKVKGKKL